MFWDIPKGAVTKNHINLLLIEEKNEECTNPSLKTLGFASLGNAVGHFNNICATGNEFVFNKWFYPFFQCKRNVFSVKETITLLKALNSWVRCFLLKVVQTDALKQQQQQQVKYGQMDTHNIVNLLWEI